MMMMRLHIKFSFDGQAISEKIFENNDHVYVYSPMAGADNPMRSNIFPKHISPVNFTVGNHVTINMLNPIMGQPF